MNIITENFTISLYPNATLIDRLSLKLYTEGYNVDHAADLDKSFLVSAEVDSRSAESDLGSEQVSGLECKIYF